MKRVLAGIAAAAILTATTITCQPDRTPHAGAVNHCPVGCVETDQSTPIGMTIITQQTRGPWIFAVPSGVQTPSVSQTVQYTTSEHKHTQTPNPPTT